MTIQDLGSIGELVGAVATVATLLYLAFQIRQNSHLLHTSIVQADRQANVELTRIVAGDSGAARIMHIGLSDHSSLTNEEQMQFSALMSLTFAALDQSQQLGSLKDSVIRGWIERPSVRAHREEFREIYSDALVARTQAIIESKPATE